MRILVTGATGRVGPYVLRALLETDAQLIVATPDRPMDSDRIEWRQTDLIYSSIETWKDLLVGVDVVIHLAAELWNPAKMLAVNETASQILAMASEAAGVKRFIYSSTVGVYGFPACTFIDEETPTLAAVIDPVRHYSADKYLLDYSLTKLRGETVIHQALNRTELVVLRFANVVMEAQFTELLNWPLSRRLWRGARNTHQIYAGDVAAAVRHTALELKMSDRFEIFIVSEDHIKESTYADLFGLIEGRQFESSLVKAIGGVLKRVNRLKDWIKFRSMDLGIPAGEVRYNPGKLIRSGFTYRYGIRNIQKKVIRESSGL